MKALSNCSISLSVPGSKKSQDTRNREHMCYNFTASHPNVNLTIHRKTKSASSYEVAQPKLQRYKTRDPNH